MTTWLFSLDSNNISISLSIVILINRSRNLSLYSLARCRLFEESRRRILLFFNLVFWVSSNCFCVWTCANVSFYIVSITTLLVNVFDGWCRYL